jgi:hypothetical protein
VRISSQLRAAARVLVVLRRPVCDGAIARSVPEPQLAGLGPVELAPQQAAPLRLPVRQRLERGKPNQPLRHLSISGNNKASPYTADLARRCVPTSKGPYDPAKPKNAAIQASAEMDSSGSLHAGSSAAPMRASAAMTIAA